MIQNSIDLLGLRAADRVTGYKGVVTSVAFDLYGCVQVAITPPASDGKYEQGCWFDINRLDVSRERVMQTPAFRSPDADPLRYERGPAEKPSAGRRG